MENIDYTNKRIQFLKYGELSSYARSLVITKVYKREWEDATGVVTGLSSSGDDETWEIQLDETNKKGKRKGDVYSEAMFFTVIETSMSDTSWL